MRYGIAAVVAIVMVAMVSQFGYKDKSAKRQEPFLQPERRATHPEDPPRVGC